MGMFEGEMSREKCLGKMSEKLSGRGWGRKEFRDPENQFSFIRKTYKQLMFAIVQVVETFLNIRIRFQSDFNQISIRFQSDFNNDV